ncbi:MAG TPA: hypothetical protein VLA34_10080, partial [Candidatus Krumholzibacterium sp.]|nr:hypothetical protein [Candidatus Krumholzibacterium sp.]
MIGRESLFRFVEANFDYLLVIDADEKIVHASESFRRDCLIGCDDEKDLRLEQLLTPFSYDTFKSAMKESREGVRGVGIFTPARGNMASLPMKTGYVDSDKGEVFLFFRNKLAGLSKVDGWEKDERVKELACIYEVAELVEQAETVKEFFTKFPRVVSHGMLYPEEVVVYTLFQGVEYGQKPQAKFISVKLIVGKREEGEIRVGYNEDKYEVLQEEQKMLDEMVRTLKLALERKSLREELIDKQEESQEYS